MAAVGEGGREVLDHMKKLINMFENSSFNFQWEWEGRERNASAHEKVIE